ncbi:MAG: hypothetical protein M3331_08020 [Actinomycetota bacterium]|nr:hypothetical protein [Actinomycetota bacterium]
MGFKPLLACSAAGVSLVFGACMGGDERKRGEAEAPSKRVGAAASLSEAEQEVAEVVERFEAATRRGDERELCDSILLIEGSGLGLRRPRDQVCVGDPELAPRRELEEAGVASRDYELTVTGVTVKLKDDKFAPDAIATVRMPEGAPNEVESFELKEVEGEWRLFARQAPEAEQGPYAAFECSDGDKAKLSNTDHFLSQVGEAPQSAREVLDNQGKITKKFSFGRDLPSRRVLPTLDSTMLVRSGIGYGFAGATYELRSPDGKPLARFGVVRLDDLYFLAARYTCEDDLAAAFD